MILHILVRETRIGVRLARNPKGVVIASDFLHFFCNWQSGQMKSQNAISLKYLRIAMS